MFTHATITPIKATLPNVPAAIMKALKLKISDGSDNSIALFLNISKENISQYIILLNKTSLITLFCTETVSEFPWLFFEARMSQKCLP